MDKDLYDMASDMHANVADATIRSKAQAVMNAFGSVVLWEGHTNAYADVPRTRSSGVARAVQPMSRPSASITRFTSATVV